MPPHPGPPGFPSEAERALRADLHRSPGRLLLTGGQTGVDTAAALAAVEVGLPVHLVFPLGYRQEDGPLSPVRRAALAGTRLHELTSPEFANRTWACAYLADAVILVDPAGGAGCQETVRAAEHLGRPLLALGPDAELHYSQRIAPRLAPASRIARWLARHDPPVLMIAGCRGSILASEGKEAAMLDQLAEIMQALASA